MPVSTVVRESIEITADPESVYDLIADVASVGEFSPEATGALGAGARLTEGDKFWGTNRRGPWFWVTRCTVTRADRGTGFAFDVDAGPLAISSWSYEIEPTATGCVVTESWVDRRVGRRGELVRKAGALVIPGPRDEHNRRGIRQTLQRLKAAAESGVGI